MKATAALAVLAFAAVSGTAAQACEASREWFGTATEAEMIGCMRLDFLSERAADLSNILHLAIGAGAGTDVLEAIRSAARGDWETLRAQRDGAERTALHVAAASADDARVVTWLLAAGGDADAVMPPFAEKTPLLGRVLADRGTVPLHLAARRPGGAAIVTALLAGGADAGREDARGDRPVHLGARVAQTADTLAAFLANDGGAFDGRGAGGVTALMAAAAADRPVAVLAYMLDAGADADARTDAEATALQLSAQRATDPESVRLLFGVSDDPCEGADRAAGAIARLEANAALRSDRGLRRMFHEACVEDGR